MVMMETRFGTYEVNLQLGKYQADGSLAIEAWSPAEGPIARLTVCLDDRSLGEDEAYVDTNNCPWATEFIEKNGFGKPTGFQRQSGYCIYPAYKFNREKMEAV